MLITKHGDTAVEYICKSCNCEFVATKLDRKIEQNMYLHKIRYYVSCPECGRKVDESFSEWVSA